MQHQQVQESRPNSPLAFLIPVPQWGSEWESQIQIACYSVQVSSKDGPHQITGPSIHLIILTRVDKSKMDSLQYETLLLEKVLRISLSARSLCDTRWISLPNASTDLLSYSSTSFSANLTFLDSVLVERLSLPGTNILQYSSESYHLTKEELAKSWSVKSEQAKSLLIYLLEILVSYSALAITQSEMYPEQSPVSHSDELTTAALRLLQFLGTVSRVSEFLSKVVEYWDGEFPGFKGLVLENALQQLGERVKNSEMKETGHVGTLRGLLDMSGGVQVLLGLEWGADDWTGEQLEGVTVLGPYFSHSCCPRQEYMRRLPFMSPLSTRQRDSVFNELNTVKTMKDMARFHSKYRDMTKLHCEGLLEVVKKLLRTDKTKFLD